jgi:AcrR family transcriptional regulator
VNKARRIATLLAAARFLIERGESTDFTMQQLADRAGLSLATTYNLIGTKAAVLYELLSDGLRALSARQAAVSQSAPDERVSAMASLAVGFFGAEPDYYRPLMRYLLGVYEPTKRPLFMARAIAFWRIAVSDSESDGTKPLLDNDLEDRAQCLHLTFTGALDLWVHGELSLQDFENAMARQIRFIR